MSMEIGALIVLIILIGCFFVWMQIRSWGRHRLRGTNRSAVEKKLANVRNQTDPFRRLIESRAYDLALYRTLHIGDLFGTLIDQEDYKDDVRIVLHDGVRDLLQQYRLAAIRLRDDKTSLAFADRGQEVHYPHRDLFLFGLEDIPLISVKRRQIIK